MIAMDARCKIAQSNKLIPNFVQNGIESAPKSAVQLPGNLIDVVSNPGERYRNLLCIHTAERGLWGEPVEIDRFHNVGDAVSIHECIPANLGILVFGKSNVRPPEIWLFHFCLLTLWLFCKMPLGLNLMLGVLLFLVVLCVFLWAC
jgi:hypothetical protein